jgi:hypothetical protein
MTQAQLPIQTEPLIDDKKFITLPWQIWAEGVTVGDPGTTFTPTFTGLTETGPATITGIYYRLSQKVCFFRITITPTTDTSATLGTTYCNNFPLTFTNNGVSYSISGFTVAAAGITAGDNRIYTGTWTNIANAITIVGFGEVR